MTLGRKRSLKRQVLDHLPLEGCVIFFGVEENGTRHMVHQAYGGMLCIHKINGHFLNRGENNASSCDLYVCLSTADLTE